MGLIKHRINLDTAVFPLLSELLGRTVIVRGTDQTHPATFATEIASDPPQLYYAHNVLPTPYGYQSIGYTEFINPATSDYADFSSQVTARESSTGRAAILGFTKSGKILVSTLASPGWVEIAPSDGKSIAGRSISFAFVRGITYIYFYKLGCYVYHFDTGTLERTTLGGLAESTIYGIVGAQGYLVVFGVGNAVAWSSVLDPTDFVPSLVTGAGAGNIEGAQGETAAAIATQNGLIFLNAANATAGLYQGNGRFPFAFVTVAGCGGLSDPTFAASSVLDSPVAYAYTTSGLQAISPKQADFITPEITEFLSGRRLEDFNELTGGFEITTPSNVIKKKLAWVADRYLIISYGDELLTHAIVLDTLTRRMGKLKIDHVSIFEFTLYDQTIYETPKKSIGILKADGTVVVVDTDIASTTSSGVAILGKYQFVRERWLQLQAVELENILDSEAFGLTSLITYDGKSLRNGGVAYNTGNAGLCQKYLFNIAALNHSLLCQGRFNLVSGILSFNVVGKR